MEAHGATASYLHQQIGFVLGMLIVSMTVALLVRRWRLPYTMVLVIVGLVIALLTKRMPTIGLSSEQYQAICYNLLLPVLLFEAALNLKWEFFVRIWRGIFTLALPGTLVSIGLVGFLVHRFLGVPLLQSLLLGAIISPTDPLSVLAMFRELGVSKRLSVLVEGESLFNDAVGLVIFTILLDAIQPGAHVSIGGGVSSFFIVSIGGAVVGAVLGVAASRITSYVDDHLIEVTLSTVLAFASFMGAEAMSLGGHQFSGIIAVVVAGLCMGNYGKTTGMSPTTLVALHTFWEYVAFVVNSIVFLLIGMELGLESQYLHLPTVIVYAGLVYLILLLARAVVSYTAGHLLSRFGQAIPLAWRHTLFWGGLKGALSMIMVLSISNLDRQWQGSDFLLPATFGVVFISLMLQGLTIRRVVTWLGLVHRGPGAVELYEKLVGEIVIHRAAIAELKRLRATHVVTPRLFESLSAPHQDAVLELEAEIDQLQEGSADLERAQIVEARRLVHHAEKSALLNAFHRGLISDGTFGQLVQEIDEKHGKIEADLELSEDAPAEEDKG